MTTTERNPRTCVCGHVHPEATDEHGGECEAADCPCGASSHAPIDEWQQTNCMPCRHWVGGRCAQRRILTGAEGCPGFAARDEAYRCPRCGSVTHARPGAPLVACKWGRCNGVAIATGARRSDGGDG